MELLSAQVRELLKYLHAKQKAQRDSLIPAKEDIYATVANALGDVKAQTVFDIMAISGNNSLAIEGVMKGEKIALIFRKVIGK